jgi:hypothetical protein
MEPFCRGVFGSRSSVPSQCVAELRTTSLPEPPCVRAVPTTPADRNGCMCRLLPRPTRPSPNSGRVGIRIVLFEACSGFTRVTAGTLAQPPVMPKACAARRGLCHGASTGPVAQPPRPSATSSIDNSLGGTLLHRCFAPSRRTRDCGHLCPHLG